mmetsp:Transcript_12045/g.30925  ORF Transcript_12045/g.30925 Transcript_12045/m.30925 type:complete len:415 (+) Transcript_12045:158-1402(+)
MTMEDESSAMVFQPSGGYAMGGDFDKDLLWDGAAFDFGNFSDDRELLQQFDFPGMDAMPNMPSQTSSASVSAGGGDEQDSKEVVMAAASAAGLNRGGLKRAAFSMGDLQALQPASLAVNSYHQPSAGMPLEPVLEGVQTLITSIPSSMPQMQQHMPVSMPQHAMPQHSMPHNSMPQQTMPMYSYPLMQPQSTQPMQVAVQRAPGQLTNLSIEQIEEQLQRTREAAAAGNMHGQAQMMQQQQQFYTVAPQVVKTDVYPQFRQGPMMMVGAPGQPGAMAPPPPMMAIADSRPAMGGGLRRVQSAVELRRPSDDPSEPAPSFLQEETADDGTMRVGKLTPEERRQKILRYRQKRHERNFKKKIKYTCRKTLADSRPRVRGRFARNDELGAKPPPENGAAGSEVNPPAAAPSAMAAVH